MRAGPHPAPEAHPGVWVPAVVDLCSWSAKPTLLASLEASRPGFCQSPDDWWQQTSGPREVTEPACQSGVGRARARFAGLHCACEEGTRSRGAVCTRQGQVGGHLFHHRELFQAPLETRPDWPEGPRALACGSRFPEGSAEVPGAWRDARAVTSGPREAGSLGVHGKNRRETEAREASGRRSTASPTPAPAHAGTCVRAPPIPVPLRVQGGP